MAIIDMTDPAQRDFYFAAQLKGQLKIIKAGMTIRGLTKTAALSRATKITGSKYTRSQIGNAIADLEAKVEAMIKGKATT
jgi:hypothetical protein